MLSTRVLDYIRQALAHAVTERALSPLQQIDRCALQQAQGLELVAQDVGRPVRPPRRRIFRRLDLKPRPLNVSVQISVRTVSAGWLLRKSLFLMVGRLGTAFAL
jgi:hypothetical protein